MSTGGGGNNSSSNNNNMNTTTTKTAASHMTAATDGWWGPSEPTARRTTTSKSKTAISNTTGRSDATDHQEDEHLIPYLENDGMSGLFDTSVRESDDNDDDGLFQHKFPGRIGPVRPGAVHVSSTSTTLRRLASTSNSGDYSSSRGGDDDELLSHKRIPQGLQASQPGAVHAAVTLLRTTSTGGDDYTNTSPGENNNNNDDDNDDLLAHKRLLQRPRTTSSSRDGSSSHPSSSYDDDFVDDDTLLSHKRRADRAQLPGAVRSSASMHSSGGDLYSSSRDNHSNDNGNDDLLFHKRWNHSGVERTSTSVPGAVATSTRRSPNIAVGIWTPPPSSSDAAAATSAHDTMVGQPALARPGAVAAAAAAAPTTDRSSSLWTHKRRADGGTMTASHDAKPSANHTSASLWGHKRLDDDSTAASSVTMWGRAESPTNATTTHHEVDSSSPIHVITEGDEREHWHMGSDERAELASWESEQQQRRSGQRRVTTICVSLLLVGLVLVVLIVVALVVVMGDNTNYDNNVDNKNNRNDRPKTTSGDRNIFGALSTPTASPTRPHPNIAIFRQALVDVVPQEWIDASPTAFEAAVEWYARDDPLSHDDNNEDDASRRSVLAPEWFVQRFVLIWLWFHTTQQGPWNSCNPPTGDETEVCTWEILAVNEDEGSVPDPVTLSDQIRYMSGRHECDWVHVECDDNNRASSLVSQDAELRHVTGLILEGNGLTGSFPIFLALLPNLTSLTLAWNRLTGPLPAQIDRLTGLTRFHLLGTALEGSIPDELYNLTGLQDVLLSSNQFDGGLSPRVGQLVNVVRLEISSHPQMRGDLPTELGLLSSNLLDLRVANQKLSNGIPTELGRLRQLTHLDMSRNSLNGPIPESFVDLNKLEELYLFGNLLRGNLPNLYTPLATHVRLDSNNLQGPLPDSLYQNQGHMKEFSVSENHDLTGRISESIGNFTNLEILGLRLNQFTGPLPRALVGLTNLRSLEITNNNFDGPFPEELCDLSRMQVLMLEAFCVFDSTKDVSCSCCECSTQANNQFVPP